MPNHMNLNFSYRKSRAGLGHCKVRAKWAGGCSPLHVLVILHLLKCIFKIPLLGRGVSTCKSKAKGKTPPCTLLTSALYMRGV